MEIGCSFIDNAAHKLSRAMPKPLRRTDAPIDWSVHTVANHSVLTSGVGPVSPRSPRRKPSWASSLATIRWENAPQAIEAWAAKRTVREKLKLVETEANLSGAGHLRMAVVVLDAFTSLAKKRNKLAHGFFGIVKDRENQFA